MTLHPDQKSGPVVAASYFAWTNSFISGMRKRKLNFKPDLAKDSKSLCLLSIASWRDKIRRRRRKGKSGGGVGG